MQRLRLGRSENTTPVLARVHYWAARFARVSDREPGVSAYWVSSGGSYEDSQLFETRFQIENSTLSRPEDASLNCSEAFCPDLLMFLHMLISPGFAKNIFEEHGMSVLLFLLTSSVFSCMYCVCYLAFLRKPCRSVLLA